MVGREKSRDLGNQFSVKLESRERDRLEVDGSYKKRTVGAGVRRERKFRNKFVVEELFRTGLVG